jgi:hypothetical protein
VITVTVAICLDCLGEFKSGEIELAQARMAKSQVKIDVSLFREAFIEFHQLFDAFTKLSLFHEKSGLEEPGTVLVGCLAAIFS